jgi:hypothetical protein
MDEMEVAMRFSRWALELVFFTPVHFVFALVLISIVWAGIKQRPFRARLWQPHHWLVLTHLLFFAAAVALGVLCANDNRTAPDHSGRLANLCLGALFYGSFGSCAFWIWRMKGFRWFASSLMALIELPTFGAVFVAGMSITGDWL